MDGLYRRCDVLSVVFLGVLAKAKHLILNCIYIDKINRNIINITKASIHIYLNTTQMKTKVEQFNFEVHNPISSIYLP